MSNIPDLNDNRTSGLPDFRTRGNDDFRTSGPPDFRTRGNPPSCNVSFLTWQLIDATFPSGGFAHSGGVEAAMALGGVRSEADLVGLLRDGIRQWATQSGPLTAGAFDVSSDLQHMEGITEIDAWCAALLAGNAVAAQASRAQGVSFLMAAEGLCPAIAELRQHLRTAASPAHLAVIMGACGRLLGCDRSTTLAMSAYVNMRGCLSAAVRLNVIGPLAAQVVQASLGDDLAAAITTASALPWRDAATSRPFLDLEQGHHGRLYSRLFQS